MTPAEAMTRAAAAAAAGDTDTASALCRAVLARDPAHEPALELLTQVLLRAGRGAEAVAAAHEALAHFRRLQLCTTTTYGLHVLCERGFEPQGILDIGAYDGEFSLLARQFFPRASLLMVEPQAQKQTQLHKVVGDLGGDAHVRKVLLGDRNRAACVFHQTNTSVGSTGSSLYPEASEHPREPLTMPMRTLDGLLAEFPNRRFDLIKLDVQGAELDVLRGATACLPQVEVLFVELSLHVVNHGAPRLAEVVAVLDAHGFAMFDLLPLPRANQGLQLQTDAVFVRRDSHLWPRPSDGNRHGNHLS